MLRSYVQKRVMENDNNNNMNGVHWCNICSEMVNPITEADNKCPICDTEFAEIIMDNIMDQSDNAIDLRSTWMFILYAPIFLGLMGAISPLIPPAGGATPPAGEDETESELTTRRRGSTSYVMHLFRGLHVRSFDNNNRSTRNRSIDASNMVVIDPFTDGALIFRVPNMNHHTTTSNQNESTSIGSFHEFLVGSGFDLLLQQLAQNGGSGYGSVVNPPTKKAAIEALPSVIISEEILQCMVCLEEIEIGNEAKEMPCLHKFHGDCIISWLKPHSSCPVCRFQMPFEDFTAEISNDGNQNSELVTGSRRNWFPMLQSFNNFLPPP